ncbi:MAG: hypothetical protein AAFW69_08560, partial [Pseudomonadota bacterium]
MSLFRRERIEAPCTVEVSHTFDSLHAHVRFDGGEVVHPGDEVLVHGAPVEADMGVEAVEGVTHLDRAGCLDTFASEKGHGGSPCCYPMSFG